MAEKAGSVKKIMSCCLMSKHSNGRKRKDGNNSFGTANNNIGALLAS